jgi:large subunit ribosomal protein L25
MVDKHTLSVTPRTLTGRKVNSLRRSGIVPANVFGKHVDSTSLQVDAKLFDKLYAQSGGSTLVYLKTDGLPDRPVLIREVSKHPVSGQIMHIDFNQVSLKEKVTAPVSILLIDEAPAEKEKLGILVQQLDEVEVEALPTDMPEHLEISVANLAAVDDSVTVGDIKLDGKIEIKTDPETIVAKIEAFAAEEPVEAPVAEGEAVVEGTGLTGETTEDSEQPTAEKTE